MCLCYLGHIIYIFSGSCYIFVYRYCPEHVQSVLASGRCAISVWRAMRKEGLGTLVRIDGRFNAQDYCDVIDKTLVPYVLDRPFPDGCYLLQQDRSPVHRARRVSAMLEALGMCQL